MLKDRQLDTEVAKPADAQRYAVERRPSTAKAQAVREAEPTDSSRGCCALRSEATHASGVDPGPRAAEASAMREATAYASTARPAVLDLLAGMLPQLVKEAARRSAIDKVTVISTDGAIAAHQERRGKRHPGDAAGQRSPWRRSAEPVPAPGERLGPDGATPLTGRPAVASRRRGSHPKPRADHAERCAICTVGADRSSRVSGPALGDLDRVECGALAQVVVADEESEAPTSSTVGSTR